MCEPWATRDDNGSGVLALQLTRDIRNEELLVSYGSHFWSEENQPLLADSEDVSESEDDERDGGSRLLLTDQSGMPAKTPAAQPVQKSKPKATAKASKTPGPLRIKNKESTPKVQCLCFCLS